MSDMRKKSPDTFFKRFEHFIEGDSHFSYEFIGQTLDITLGARLALEIIERDELAKDNEEDTVLGVYDRSVLLRMVIGSLDLLGHKADRIIHQRNTFFREQEKTLNRTKKTVKSCA